MLFNYRKIAKCRRVLIWALPIVVLEIIFPHAGMAAFDAHANAPERPLENIAMYWVPDQRAEAAAESARQAEVAREESDRGGQLPSSADRPVKRTARVTVTAYASVPELTDSDPFTMANGKTVFDGAVATNVLPFGTHIRFPELFGSKVFEVHDRMNERYQGVYIVDIWHSSKEAAVKFGAKYNVLMEILE